MPATQADKATAFQALHRDPGTFVIANAWDGGAARILQGLGFSAIATSSGAAAGVLGRLDGKITRDEALSQARNIVAATDLPVSADLEKGFGDTPEIVAETVHTRITERGATRADDRFTEAAMEDRKREGYF